MNAIKQIPVTIEDINIYEKIFGLNIYTFKVKIVRTKPKAVTNDYIDILQEFNDTHKKISFGRISCISKGICFLLPYPRQLSSFLYNISQRWRLIYWIKH